MDTADSADPLLTPACRDTTKFSNASDSQEAVSEERVTETMHSEDETSYQLKQPVTHFNSLSVDYRSPKSSEIKRGTAQIVEHDLGSSDDFWNIHVNITWRARQSRQASNDATESSDDALEQSVDDLLMIRTESARSEPIISVYLRGGRLFGDFIFPNGPEAAEQFIDALRLHVETILMEESPVSKLLLVEKKPRMRRVAPTLMNDIGRDEEDDFSSLLRDLEIDSVNASYSARRRTAGSTRTLEQGQDLGLVILSQFARVTQAARNIGDEVSMLLDEKKRRAEAERRERETAARRRALDIHAEIVASTDVERELPPRLILEHSRGLPVTLEVWNASFGETGVIEEPLVIRQAIFAGGVEPEARRFVWPFLLGVFPWNSTQKERATIMQTSASLYEDLKRNRDSLHAAAHEDEDTSLAEQEDSLSKDRPERVRNQHAYYVETSAQIKKDIVRTDRTVDIFVQDGAAATSLLGILLEIYALYDSKISYCQGMSDFLSPIVYALGADEELMAFWCFEALMQRIERNFRIDQSGIRAQLGKLKKLIEIADPDLAKYFAESDPDYYCCFRWILVQFKRELPFDATARFWEVLWTLQVAENDLHIFVAGALLMAHRRKLLCLERGAFDCLLRYINDMSMRIDIDFAIREGELCFRKYAQQME